MVDIYGQDTNFRVKYHENISNQSKLLANKKGKHLAFDFRISTISCKISPRIKGYESKYPSRMNYFLKCVYFLTLDLIMNDK